VAIGVVALGMREVSQNSGPECRHRHFCFFYF
jgi:hypothetical protein